MVAPHPTLRRLLPALGLVATLVVAGPATATEPDVANDPPPAAATPIRLHLTFTAVSCRIGPCPDWHVVEDATGRAFEAVVDLAALDLPPAVRDGALYRKLVLIVDGVVTPGASQAPQPPNLVTALRLVGTEPASSP